MPNTRPTCYALPSERIVMLLWLKRTYPSGWAALWARVAKAWRHA
jgi:hypothetical protein